MEIPEIFVTSDDEEKEKKCVRLGNQPLALLYKSFSSQNVKSNHVTSVNPVWFLNWNNKKALDSIKSINSNFRFNRRCMSRIDSNMKQGQNQIPTTTTDKNHLNVRLIDTDESGTTNMECKSGYYFKNKAISTLNLNSSRMKLNSTGKFLHQPFDSLPNAGSISLNALDLDNVSVRSFDHESFYSVIALSECESDEVYISECKNERNKVLNWLKNA